jgi:hypothetical protein
MTARWVGREKLKAMVAGTKIVRAELETVPATH